MELRQRTFYVALPYAVFGIIAEGTRVTRAAPIARWTIGEDLLRVLAYYRAKGTVYELIDREQRPDRA